MLLKAEHISYSYGAGSSNELKVLKDISFHILKGELVALIGPSGSGKTTLIKLLNGLLHANTGSIFFEEEDIYKKKFPISRLRKEVGLVFQYPEHQLFAKTVLEDVAFGPLQMGLGREEALLAAGKALKLTGIDEESYQDSPFDLSGGQMRRVAIAGVLAMEPKLLVLDEPTAGLDPAMKKVIFNVLESIRKEKSTAIFLVSHQMEDVAQYADRVLVLSDGMIMLSGTPKEVFKNRKLLEDIGTGIPQVTALTHKMQEMGISLRDIAVNVGDADTLISEFFSLTEGEEA